LQISERVNLLQLSRVLGHHSAAFTLSVYAHLLEGDQAPALDLAEALKSESLTVSEVSTSEVAA
jgi:hypothetical protein